MTVHVCHVTRLQLDTDGGLVACITIERHPSGVHIENPPAAVDLPPDIRDTLLRWLDPRSDQP